MLTKPPRFTLHPSLSLRTIASHLPFTYTGADFYALCSDAMLKAVTRQATLVDTKIRAINAERAASHPPDSPGSGPISTAYFFDHFATPEDVAVMVTEQDFLDAHRELVPSVSAGELAHYERVRATFEGVKEKAEQLEKEKVNGTGNGNGAARLGLAGRRTASGASGKSVGGGKGKGKVVVKGKGKGVDRGSGDNDEDYDDDGEGYVNGVRDVKGKGKEVVPPIVAGSGAPFGDGAGSGDEGLYE